MVTIVSDLGISYLQVLFWSKSLLLLYISEVIKMQKLYFCFAHQKLKRPVLTLLSDKVSSIQLVHG